MPSIVTVTSFISASSASSDRLSHPQDGVALARLDAGAALDAQVLLEQVGYFTWPVMAPVAHTFTHAWQPSHFSATIS